MMLENPEMLLDLTGYRALAGYVLALVALQQNKGCGPCKLMLNTARDANWISARLKNQGYNVLAIEPRDDHTFVQIRNC